MRIKSTLNALIFPLLYMLVYEGIFKTILLPFIAAINAILIPIFPDVCSINVL
uniref:Cysteine synthase n=1 Tax=Solanum tuberosum TaxID=4113 RepID=M1A103_SOLTU